MRRPGFDVCAMVREEAGVLRRFSSYYRGLGAERVRLYYDGTPPEGALDGIDGAEIVACDAAFWAGRPEGARPHAVEAAQMACYRAGRAASTADWLWIVDADEFLTGTRPVADLLASVPDGVDAIKIRTAEAVWGPGDDPRRPFGSTWFRTPMKHRKARIMTPLIYGRSAPFYRRGLIAHSAGKHFIRRDARVDYVGLHDSWRDGAPLGVWAGKATPLGNDFHVAHFDAVSFQRWSEKWRRRYSVETGTDEMHPKRHVQKRIVEQAATEGEDALYRLFVQINALSAWQVAALRASGNLFRRDIFGNSPETVA